MYKFKNTKKNLQLLAKQYKKIIGHTVPNNADVFVKEISALENSIYDAVLFFQQKHGRKPTFAERKHLSARAEVSPYETTSKIAEFLEVDGGCFKFWN